MELSRVRPATQVVAKVIFTNEAERLIERNAALENTFYKTHVEPYY